MEIKITADMICNVSNKKKTINNTFSSFNSSLDKVRSMYSESASPHKNLNDEVISALSGIEEMLQMTITDDCYKDNGKLDIVGIFKKHGNKLSIRDVKSFTKYLDTLLDNDMIDKEDYAKVIQMISIQNKYRNVSDNLEYEAINTITNNDDDSKNE